MPQREIITTVPIKQQLFSSLFQAPGATILLTVAGWNSNFLVAFLGRRRTPENQTFSHSYLQIRILVLNHILSIPILQRIAKTNHIKSSTTIVTNCYLLDGEVLVSDPVGDEKPFKFRRLNCHKYHIKLHWKPVDQQNPDLVWWPMLGGSSSLQV